MSPSLNKPAKKAKHPRTFATGGGDATASGVNFQQFVGAVIGVWMLTETPIDPRLRLGAAKIVGLRMETEAPLDDVLASTSDGGFIAIQAKSKLSMSTSTVSEFGKTVEQIVRQWRLSAVGSGDKGWNRCLDTTKDRLVIAVGPDSPATLRQDLARGLEARRQNGPPVLTVAEKKALAIFDTCIKAAWAEASTDPLPAHVLEEIGHLTFVYQIDPEGPDRAALAASLSPALSNPADGPSALNLLERVSGDLMSARGGHDIAGLRIDLIGRGAKLGARPDYRDDIAALKAYTLQIEQTLRTFEVVEAETGNPVGIERHCQPAVNLAAREGDLLLIGEPGAGKSAVINALCRGLRVQGFDVVELAVDRFSVESLEGLSRALHLSHSLPDVLQAWDGATPAFLIIDALDANRGGPEEPVFKRLIEAVIELKGRWSVVASIRTFDLRLGQNFRALFKGMPPAPAMRGDGFPNVRHIQVPPWSNAEFSQLLSLSPHLAEVLRDCPAKLRELAMVPFNTRLLADLVAAGAISQDFGAIDSQRALLDLYWERRVERHGTAAEVCLRIVVTEMVSQRALRAARLAVAAQDPQMLDVLTAEGVLIGTDQQRSIQFRHHLLFDYVASRVFLDADAIVAGHVNFPKMDGLGLILAPAMGFLIRGLWIDDPGHDRFWSAIAHLLGSQDCDPVIRSLVARMAAELPMVAKDVLPFAQAIVAGNSKALSALPQVAGAMAVRLEDEPSMALAPWVRLALELSANPGPTANVLRMLSFMLVDRVKGNDLRQDLGVAVRSLLRYGLTLDRSRDIAMPAIGFVADTLATDVAASISLLSQIFDNDRFDRFGHEEIPALARKIASIAQASPEFAVEIYQEAYSREVSDKRITSFGSGQILNLSSNAKQDFESARWALGEYFPKFLADFPIEATRAFLGAMDGYVAFRHPLSEGMTAQTVLVMADEVRLQPDHSYIWAHEAHPQFAQDGAGLLSKFEAFLETGDESAAIEAAKCAIQRASLSVVWSRLFMAAAARGSLLAQLLAPYVTRVEFLVAPDTRKDAIDLLAAHYDQLSEVERQSIETAAINANFESFDYPIEAKQGFLMRLFGTIGRERLSTQAAQALIGEKPPEDEVNRRLFEITTGAMRPATYYWLDEQARSSPNIAQMISAIDAVTAELHLEPNNVQEPVNLPVALAMLTALKVQIDAGLVNDPTLRDRADGVFAQGVHRLANSAFVFEDTTNDVMEQLVGWIEFSSFSPSPEVDATSEAKFEQFSSWGSPSARLEAVEAALDLTLKRPETYCRFQSLIDRMLVDPHPAVRLNAALRLVRIWDLDREGFWSRASQIISNEDNRAVLDAFITQVLGNLVWHGAAQKVADLVLPLLDRLHAGDARNAAIREHLVQMTLQFWIRFDFSGATTLVNAWTANSIDNVVEVRSAVVWLRDDYTAGLRGDESPDDSIRRVRAMTLLATAVKQAEQDLTSYGDFNALTEAQTARARSAFRLIDTACQQLYFSSGAFQNANAHDSRPAMTSEGAQVFFAEVAPTLRRIGANGDAHTVYYLIQLLEHLIEADPAGVFDLIAVAVLNGGRRGGYEFESLGADLLVKITGRYLADHKEVFDDPSRRAALMDTLDTFVTAGWPAVRRLLYRLPELLQ